MPRDEGFGHADIDVGLFDDIKVKRLWRLLRDPAKMHHAMTVFVAAILASWADAEPTTLIDSAPVWTDVPDDILDALKRVELVDSDGRIPSESFARWFGPATERRARRQAASATANAKRWGSQSERNPNGVRVGSQTHTQTHTSARAPATGEGGPAREEGETLKQFLSRIGAPVPDVAADKETTNGKDRTEGSSNPDGKSGRRPRRRRATSG